MTLGIIIELIKASSPSVIVFSSFAEKILTKIPLALDIVKRQADKEIIQEISVKLNKAKKLKWLKEKEQSDQKKNSTLAFLNSLVNKDQSISSSQKKEKLALIQEFTDEQNHTKSSSEVPETLCCKITFVRDFCLRFPFSYTPFYRK